MPETTHYKVLAAPIDLCTHRGDMVQLSAEKAAEYAEKGEYFRPATPEEVEAYTKTQETATLPQAAETAMLPGGAVKTAKEAADLLAKGAKDADKDPKK
ncbi:hypothetical protein [Hymenobacter cheonanensis]|uniref:hypothetical protein n=1 Tax=Hymenobacter sp. CA2-7 TaxID=3063993 RepID=UPI002713D775|nr:hypothetical protein [Hymenobacter sp. CA2-7]MDO7888281.1 hypothetical protein [Hymenobacter sp. CA2-7]